MPEVNIVIKIGLSGAPVVEVATIRTTKGESVDDAIAAAKKVKDFVLTFKEK